MDYGNLPVDSDKLVPHVRGSRWKPRRPGQHHSGRGVFAVAARVAHACRVTDLAGRLLKPRGCLLMFHRITLPEYWALLPNRNFYLDTDFLERLLIYLKTAGWAVVTLHEALRRLEAKDDGRFVNISIDDTYRDTWELAVPIFRRHGVPATLFVTTGIPDGSLTMWLAGLETVIRERDTIIVHDQGYEQRVTAPDGRRKMKLFRSLQQSWEGREPEIRYSRFCASNGYAPHQLHDQNAIRWEMLMELRNDPCVEIGAHTLSHARLSTLTGSEAAREIAESRTRLEQHLGIAVRHFAFPYGQPSDYGTRERDLVRDAGYSCAVTTRKGVLTDLGGDLRYQLPRNTLNGAHRDIAQIEAHLSGLSGIAAGILKAELKPVGATFVAI